MTVQVDYKSLESTLINTQIPLSKRFRALFTLKSLKTNEAVQVISKGFTDSSALLKHELAYVLGQMKNPSALPILESVLQDDQEDCMVRHEAAEAMGAIGLQSSLPILHKYAQDESTVIRETCELAIQLIEFESKNHKESDMTSPYSSIDPAPPAPKSISTSELKSILLNPEKTLFERYRAMFALRDRGDEESIQALGQGFQDNSALFRHEIAYVFGQMQHPSSVPFLINVLSNENEQGMVRHEAAEALGSIAHPDCLSVLEKFSKDKEGVVKESCIVGLDMYEYEQSGDFQYAEALPIS